MLKIIESNYNFISFEPLNSSVALIVILGTILGDKSRHLCGICGAFLAIQDEVYWNTKFCLPRAICLSYPLSQVNWAPQKKLVSSWWLCLCLWRLQSDLNSFPLLFCVGSQVLIHTVMSTYFSSFWKRRKPSLACSNDQGDFRNGKGNLQIP